MECHPGSPSQGARFPPAKGPVFPPAGGPVFPPAGLRWWPGFDGGRADEDAILIKFPWAYPREELRMERILKEWSPVLALAVRSKASAVLTGTADFSMMTSTSGTSATEQSTH